MTTQTPALHRRGARLAAARLGLSLAAAAGSLGFSWWRFGADFRSFFGRPAAAQ